MSTRTTHLELIRDALFAIELKSTPNELNFSIANEFVTKKRNR